jgi:hypothetical protein
MASRFDVDKRALDFIAVRLRAYDRRRYEFYVVRVNGKRILGGAMMGENALAERGAAVTDARAFAEREARAAGMID